MTLTYIDFLVSFLQQMASDVPINTQSPAGEQVERGRLQMLEEEFGDEVNDSSGKRRNCETANKTSE
ncbi:hypothetical protein NQZ68_036634 [Dissostichus eleginoides]|nr:hypothetical protein NQZ68_036634 [Dissostichus eleginoides]